MAKFIYLIKVGDFHKIGIADNLRGRFLTIKTNNPGKIEVRIAARTLSASLLEKALLEYFKDKTISGEWLAISEDEILFIKHAIEIFCFVDNLPAVKAWENYSQYKSFTWNINSPLVKEGEDWRKF